MMLKKMMILKMLKIIRFIKTSMMSYILDPHVFDFYKLIYCNNVNVKIELIENFPCDNADELIY